MKNDFLKGIEYLRGDKYLGKIVSKMDIPLFNHEEIFFYHSQPFQTYV